MATTLEQALTILLNSLKGGELPLKTVVDGSEFIIFYNPNTQRVERFKNNANNTTQQWSQYTGDFNNDTGVLKLGKLDDSLTIEINSTNGTMTINGEAKFLAPLFIEDDLTVQGKTASSFYDVVNNNGTLTIEYNGNGNFTQELQDKDGVIALITDIPDVTGKADLTNENQVITSNSYKSVLQSSGMALKCRNNTTTEGEYVEISLVNSTSENTQPKQYIRAYRGSSFGLGRVVLAANNQDNVELLSNGDTLHNGSVIIKDTAPVLLFIDEQDATFNTSVSIQTPTADRNLLIPDKDGTFALTSDIGNLVTLDTTQTITGDKDFQGQININPSGTKFISVEDEKLRTKKSTLGSVSYFGYGGYIINNDSNFHFYTPSEDGGSQFVIDNKSLTTLRTYTLQDNNGVLAHLDDTKSSNVFGFFDYNDSATATTPINVPNNGTFVYLTNDGLGAFTNKNYPPSGITDVWNATTNTFDFSQLPLGSKMDYRLDLEITTNSNNQEVNVVLELGIGGFNYDLSVAERSYKTPKTHKLVVSNFAYMGDLNTRDNGAKFKVSSDGVVTVKVNGWACYIHKYT